MRGGRSSGCVSRRAAGFRTPAGATTLEGVAITRAGLRQALGHRDLWIYGLALLGGYGAYFTTSQLLSEYAVTVRGFTRPPAACSPR